VNDYQKNLEKQVQSFSSLCYNDIIMRQPTTYEIQAEALTYLVEYDAEGSPYHDRSADAIADFLLESKFGQIDENCDWDEEFCDEFFEIAKDALLAAGVSP